MYKTLKIKNLKYFIKMYWTLSEKKYCNAKYIYG